MQTPEEPGQPSSSKFYYREASYNELSPELKDLVNKAFEAMDNGTFDGQAQTFSVNNSISFGMPAALGQNYWARWEYSPEEWRLFDRLDWVGSRNKFFAAVLVAVLLYLCICALLASLLLADGAQVSDTIVTMIIISFVLLIPAFLLPYFLFWRQYREARKRHRARQNGPARVTIGGLHLGDQAIWQAGLYIPIQNLDVQLVKVRFSPHAPFALHLREWHLHFRSSWRETLTILVPAGHEDEARQLAERMRSETIIDNRKKYTPPEPQ